MDDRAVIRATETGLGKRWLVVIIALLAIAIVIGAVIRGFHRNSPSQSARALSSETSTLLLKGA